MDTVKLRLLKAVLGGCQAVTLEIGTTVMESHLWDLSTVNKIMLRSYPMIDKHHSSGLESNVVSSLIPIANPQTISL